MSGMVVEVASFVYLSSPNHLNASRFDQKLPLFFQVSLVFPLSSFHVYSIHLAFKRISNSFLPPHSYKFTHSYHQLISPLMIIGIEEFDIPH